MKKEDIKRLSDAYPYLWPYEMSALPDGWAGIAERLLSDLNEIQPQPEGVFGRLINLSIRSGDGFAIAYVSLSNLGKWNAKKALALVEAIQRFNVSTSRSCQLCGDPAAVLVKEWDGSRQEMLCQHHADARLAAYEGGAVQ
ncbi:hypothetical protein Kim5_CH02887 [Rhizobium sp. Kim5]|uniref:hypothetical protein n=1 Tax=Rhizobium sp. Kim5 TaxID=2020311 RepID=UPI00019070FB|nr:hypothetical protein [Rhizobium sp. Kim5]ARQ58930.1 hypothetical protein Kim5_CH02887 [Rhizobium sp. Kim5]